MKRTEQIYLQSEMRVIAEARKRIEAAEQRIAVYLVHRYEKHES